MDRNQNDSNPLRALIDLDNFEHNLGEIRRLAGPEIKICMAVKANAYGHGLVPMARAAEASGVDALGVVFPSEARALREAGITLPILMMSSPLKEEVPEIVALDVEPFAGSLEILRLLAAQAERLDRIVGIHLEVDTGMSRNGCGPREAPELGEFIHSHPRLRFAGLCTHFAGSGPGGDYFLDIQKEKFLAVRDELVSRGAAFESVHAANSSAIIGRPDLRFTMIRPGLMAYGYYPAAEHRKLVSLRPVMTLETRVVAVRRVDAGTPVSYGMTYTTGAPVWLATLRIGYADGYLRVLSGQGRTVIRGRSYPLVGRVCMDHVMAEIGPEREVEPGDPAVLFGPGEGPGADELASLAGTVSYEILTGIGGRVSREYVRSGGKVNPAGGLPAGKAPAGETPVGETPVGETPVGETPAGKAPL